MIRILVSGMQPQVAFLHDEAMARSVLQSVGLSADQPGMELTINGVPASPDTPLKDQDIVGLYQRADHA
jgi:hypothetical protein